MNEEVIRTIPPNPEIAEERRKFERRLQAIQAHEEYDQAWRTLGQNGRVTIEQTVNVIACTLRIFRSEALPGYGISEEFLKRLKRAQEAGTEEGREAAADYFQQAKLSYDFTIYIPEASKPGYKRRSCCCTEAIFPEFPN
ncbi:MAG: hypothetical protein Q8P26_01215 [Candidatus Levybacteria bacterium]|nr:hypothetical protein [Candidatus Levybacteria bacterium]